MRGHTTFEPVSTYQLVQTDFSTTEVERFTALSIRRGSTLASLAKRSEEDVRIVLGALLLGLGSGVFDVQTIERVTERFLKEEGEWLSDDPATMLQALAQSGLVEKCPGGFVSKLEPRPGMTRSRLLDELESAAAILAERRARSREVLQAKNRAVNAPPAPVVNDEADRSFMAEAMKEAEAAKAAGEVPVGAVLVKDGEIIARAGNRTIRDHDPTAHAEVLVMREGAKLLGNHRLTGTTLYVTLEPCPMCAGAIAEARCARIVYGAADVRRGAVGGALNLYAVPGVNHHPFVTDGVMAAEAAGLLSAFFQERRGEKS